MGFRGCDKLGFIVVWPSPLALLTPVYDEDIPAHLNSERPCFYGRHAPSWIKTLYVERILGLGTPAFCSAQRYRQDLADFMAQNPNCEVSLCEFVRGMRNSRGCFLLHGPHAPQRP